MSISKYHVQYGFFCGGDPRYFTPDEESCLPEEIQRWNEACAMWDRADEEKLTLRAEEGSGKWFCDESGKPIMHVLESRYGLGVMRYPCESSECGLCEIGDPAQPGEHA